MSSSFKNRLKKGFEKIGLLGLAKAINKGLSLYKISEWATGLRLYLFNNCITHFPIHLIRIFFLRHILGVRIGKSCFIHMGVRFNGVISIGKNSVIGRNCILNGDINIMDNVSITAEVYIFTSSHFVDSPTFECFYKPVLIDDYAWIGARAMILPGVKIGKGAVLGAASIATKDIPPYSIFVGAPAKEIGKRTEELTYTLKYSPFFE